MGLKLKLKLFRRHAVREPFEGDVTGIAKFAKSEWCAGDVLASIEYELQQLKREVQPKAPLVTPGEIRIPFAPEVQLRNPLFRRDPKWWQALGFES